jgi:hypothetical protein
MHRLVIALVTLLGLTGAAVVGSYVFLFSGSIDRAAALAPADSAAYATVYLQPSTGQQMNLGGLIGRLPGFADEASLDEKIDRIVETLIADTGIDYESQLKPWLGSQISVAAWPIGDGLETASAVLVDAKDPDAARDSIAELAAEGGSSFSSETYEGVEVQVGDQAAYALVDGMVVIGTDVDAVHRVIDVSTGDASLARDATYVEAMDRLPPDYLASAFVDLTAIGEASGTSQALSGYSTLSAALVAERDGLRLSGSLPFEPANAQPSMRAGFALGGEPSGFTSWMPEGTLAEMVVFGLRGTLEEAEAAARSAPDGDELGDALDTLRAVAAFGLGIDLDADVLPLLDREVGVAITGFEAGVPSGLLLLRPDDPAAASESLDRLVDGLAGIGGTRRTEEQDGVEVTVVSVPELGDVAYTVTDGVVLIGLGVDEVLGAVAAHSSGRTLAGSDAYVQTFEVAGTRAGAEAFVQIGSASELLGLAGDLPDDTRDILAQLGTFGFTAPSRSDQIEFHAVLTVEAD